MCLYDANKFVANFKIGHSNGVNSVVLVILVPYGLCGSLTGNSYRETDQSASKIIEEWSQFYPLDNNDGTDVNKIPPLVEVIVGEHSLQSFKLHMYRKNVFDTSNNAYTFSLI